MSSLSWRGSVPSGSDSRRRARHRAAPRKTTGPFKVAAAVAVLGLGSCSAATATEQVGPGVLQPGATGRSAGMALEQHADTIRPRYTEADVRFMQHMIVHHAQALEMSRLVPDRAASEDIRLLAQRIDRSQRDEIAMMKRWLEQRGEEVPDLDRTHPHHGHAGHHADHHPGEHADREREGERARDEGGRGQDEHVDHEHAQHADSAIAAGHAGADGHVMPGMLTPEQLAALAKAEGDQFDRLFLELMIFHHEGALEMVEELFSSPGAAQDTEVFRFASHVDADQRIEIARMRRMLRAGG